MASSFSASHARKRRAAQSRERALKLCMPPKAPPGMTFLQVLQLEFRALAAATDAARRANRFWRTPAWHLDVKAAPRAFYRRKPSELRPQVHIGQLKLFLSELQFLTEWSDNEEVVVVYAGAAEGTHLLLLKRLFPHLTFELYDPRPFSAALRRVDGIKLHTGDVEGWFTTEIARTFANRRTLLISDIRSGSPTNPLCDFEACVKRDMEMQLEWMRTMRPVAAMFKFRLPYSSGLTRWLAPHTPEHLKFGIFATKSATELRLVATDPDRLQDYDHTRIEEQCFYFNNFTRVCQYRPDLSQRRGDPCLRSSLSLDDCWDCCAMREVCLAYLQKKHFEHHCDSIAPDVRQNPGVLQEDVVAAICATSALPRDIAVECARYVYPITVAMLGVFLNEVLNHCGKQARKKLGSIVHPYEHPCEDSRASRDCLSPVQWIECRHLYHGKLNLHRSEKDVCSPDVSEAIWQLHQEATRPLAPPLWKFPE